MDRFTIERKISDTLLGAAYECSFNVPVPLLPKPIATAWPRKFAKATATAKPPIQHKPRASVAIKCSSLTIHDHLRQSHSLLSADKPTGITLDDPRRERAVVAALIASGGHTNVLQCYDHFVAQEEDASVVCIVTEFCGGGDLFSYLTETPSSTHSGLGLGEHTTVSVMVQVAHGVAFLQSRLGLAHRDLSLENVLLRDGTCKVADFGLAVPVGQKCHGRAGKQLYMAPEIVASSVHGYDPAPADVWALGVMLFMLLTGSPLVDVASRDDPRFVALMDRGVGAIATAWGVEVSQELVELMDAMLSEDVTLRPTVLEVVVRLENLNAAIGEVEAARCEMTSIVALCSE